MLRILQKFWNHAWPVRGCIMLVFLCVSGLAQNIQPEYTLSDENQGNVYMNGLNFNSAIHSYERASIRYRNAGQWERALSVENKWADALLKTEKYDEADSLSRAVYLECLMRLGNYHPETGNALMNIGIATALSDNSRMFFDYLHQACLVYRKACYGANPSHARALQWLGNLYESHGDSVQARYHLQKALDMWNQIASGLNPEKGDIYRYWGLFYKRFRQPDSAYQCFRLAKKCFDLQYGPYNYQSVKCLNNIADLSDDRKEYSESHRIFDTCFLLIKKMKYPMRYPLMMTLYNQAETYFRQEHFYQAAKSIQKLLKLYCAGVDENDITSSPAENELVPNFVLKLALFFKVDILYAIFIKEGGASPKWLEAAEACNQLLEKLIDLNKEKIVNFDNLLHHQQYYAGVYFWIGEKALDLYRITNDTIYLSRALTRFEKNRNASKVLGNRFFSQIAASPRFRAQYGHIKAIGREISLQQSALADCNKPLCDSLKSRLVALKIEMDMLYWALARKDPGIFSNLYSTRPVYYSQFQKTLRKNEAALLFFEEINDITCHLKSINLIVVTDTGVRIIKIPNGKEIQHNILLLSNALKMRLPLQQISLYGKTLSDALLGQVLPLNKEREIVIIPSLYTGMIPFDVLPLPDQSLKNGFRPMICNYTIRKMHALSGFFTPSKPIRSRVKLLAVAPSFKAEKQISDALSACRDSNLAELPKALEECKEICGYFPSELLSGIQATPDAFRRACIDAGIIHVSTHGIPVRDKDEVIRLAFSSDSLPSGMPDFLDFYEITNLPVTADLVVLSACRTGEGMRSSSEGKLNLAYAFMAAGAQSAVISHWDANDYASFQIMTKFYKYLSEGEAKPQALRRAKLDFLSESDELMSHPFYWAGFEYYGNNRAVINKRYTKWLVITGIILLLAVFLWIRKYISLKYR